jgi:NADH:ubiquinone oxidoreductase subunit C
VRIQLNRLEAVFGSAIQVRNFGRSEKLSVEVEFSKLLEIATWLRMEENFRMDFLEAFTIFESKGKLIFSYFIRSHPHNLQLVLRSSRVVPGSHERVNIPSMIGIWPHAEAFETELAPLFGIEFTGSQGMGGVRKVFGNFDGFPLRKGYEWQESFEP